VLQPLLAKVTYCGKYVIILSGSFSALINLLLNSVVIAVFMYLDHVAPTLHALLVIPLIIELFVISIAFAFLLSALFVRFRDISYIWEVIIQGAFYATPILYALQRVPHRYSKFLILNPVAQIIQDARHVLVTPYALTISQIYGGDKFIWLIPITLTLLIAILAGTYFRSQSKYFAEEV
jgi:ABC-2 type transport system permease protein